MWANRGAAELGWAHDENSVAGCYVEPLDTYCDMSHLLPRESWPASDDVRTIGYFCGVLDEVEGETPAEATERVKLSAIDFMENDMAALWPLARNPDGSFDWSVLVDSDGGSGPERFDAQYWRANVTPSERYVLTPAGSVKHRLPSGESGFENLALAGDWTRNGIDGGCVEAAVISGIEAAESITGIAHTIPGRDPDWLRPRPLELPPYVEYGGRATTPPPFLSEGGRMRGLVLQGDEQRIADLVDRMFNIPAGGSTDYRSLGSNVLLLVGGFDRVSCLTPPFDRWGSVAEIMASFWVPVMAGRDLGPTFLAERLVLAVPYILVDNPMSYLGGRETYGYAKTMARFDPVDATGEHVTIEAFGGNFGRDAGGAWRPFMEVEEVGPEDGSPQRPLEGPAGLVRRLVGELPAFNSEGEIVLADFRLTAELVDSMLDGRVHQLFLKQFRDAEDGTRACYQAVVEAPVNVLRVSNKLVGRDADVTIHHLDSHPIGQELGVTSQRASIVFDAGARHGRGARRRGGARGGSAARNRSRPRRSPRTATRASSRAPRGGPGASSRGSSVRCWAASAGSERGSASLDRCVLARHVAHTRVPGGLGRRGAVARGEVERGAVDGGVGERCAARADDECEQRHEQGPCGGKS